VENALHAINADGSFMDFQEIDVASSRGVDDTKQLLETVMHTPSSSKI
jgi:DNA polymerase III, gamma/tau subunits